MLYTYLVKTSNQDAFLISNCLDEYEARIAALFEYDDPESIRIVSCVLLPDMPNMEG